MNARINDWACRQHPSPPPPPTQVASTCMAATLGRNMNARINDCGVCGGELRDFSHMGEQVGAEWGVEGGM